MHDWKFYVSPLNEAHLCERKAESFTKRGDYENALSCHERAADFLRIALGKTESDEAILSLELQIKFHEKQKDILRIRTLEKEHQRTETDKLENHEKLNVDEMKSAGLCSPTQSKSSFQSATENDNDDHVSLSSPDTPVSESIPLTSKSNANDTVSLKLLDFIRKQQAQILSMSHKMQEMKHENIRLKEKIQELEEQLSNLQNDGVNLT